MLTLMGVLLFLPLFLLGSAAVNLLYGKESQKTLFWEDRLLVGNLVLIGLAEGAQLIALMRGQSVSAFVQGFLALCMATLLLSVCLLAIVILMHKKKQEIPAAGHGGRIERLQKREGIALSIFLFFFLIQFCQILFCSAIYLETDLTLDAVVSFLTSDKIYACHPLTGFPYQQGIPTRLKILCLPTLYAAVSRLSGAEAEQVVWHFVPAMVLVLAYLAYYSLVRCLFPDNRFHRCLFMGFTALLISVGDYAYGMEGFGLMHGGFQGVTIRGAVLMPYLFGLCLRKKWRLAVLVLLAEACIVWTLYGLGAGALVLVTFYVCQRLRKAASGRKGDPQWENS